MKILIDADACPKAALQICVRIGQKYNIPVWTVASFNHNIVSDHHVVVGSASQEADIKLINLTDPSDVIVTQDWGLASMVLGKSAYCLSPTGKVYSPETIEFLLEEREMKAKFRRGGGRTKGPSKRAREDDQRFEAAIERLIAHSSSSDC
ncbi:YaiI/YqxD family protein [Sporomusa malonica]|uniref:UPF0178 protein SAMN04488500_11991 n=1 Tax=Sporomusa malonica TaxID=112901 RepID=A0A1W2E1U8_9FIRM|nr:DUF188 domain-containing protein [Sporomusa malonica]SMD03382.1 hypothetical protein SAMN04488500_11991 [Sporomusa malonica]